MKLVDKLTTLVVCVLVSLIGVSVGHAEGRMFRQIPPGYHPSLSEATVYDIKRGVDGFVWIATNEGLYRFDGEHLAKIPLPADGPVKSLAPVGNKDLIVGTSAKIYHICNDGEKYKVETLIDDKPFSATSGLSLGNGMAIIGGDDGLVSYSLKTDKATQIRLSDEVLNLSNNVIDLAQSPNAVYALTKGGIYRIDKSSHAVTLVKAEIDISALSPTSLTCSADHLYIGTSGDGVLSLNPMDGGVKRTGYTDAGNVVTSLDMDVDGKNLFIGTDGGGVTKVEISTGKMTIYRHRVSDSVSPSSNQVYSLLSDAQGLLWVGYYQHGIDYTPEANGPFELYDNPAVFDSRGIPVRALSIGKDYSAIGTREGAIIYDKSTGESWDVGHQMLRSVMVISLLEKDGKLLIGTYGGGMQVLDLKTRRLSDFTLAKDDTVFKNGHIFAIAEDHKGGIWVGTNDGLYYFDEHGNEKHFTSYLTALPQGNVYGIFFDSDGKGWICTDTGVCVYDPQRKMLRTDLFPSSFPKETRFRTIYEDSKRRLYFVPEYGYVYSCNLDLSNPRTLDFSMLEGSDAKGVVEDSFGNIWIATNRGIFLMDRSGGLMRFGLAAGLPSVSFLQAQPQSDGAGGIWFGNSEGLLRLNESKIEESLKRQILPIPTKVTVNGNPTELLPYADKNGVYTLKFDNAANNIKIGFSAFTYSLEEPDAYEYRIDDGEWQKFTRDLSVTLYELMPGKHRLHVRSAADSDYNRDKEVEVVISIPYPLSWKIGIAIIILLVIFSIGLACRIFFINRQIKNPGQEIVDEINDSGNAVSTSPQKKYAANNMSRTEVRQISAKIEEIMTKEKPYLQSDLKVGKLAELIGISSHKLSQFFSQHKDISFYDYVNKYRVDEFKRMVKEEDVRNLTLSAMAEKAGFSSRASFFRYFKNIEGISPGEYLKAHQKG